MNAIFFYEGNLRNWSVPVAARSKTQVCGRSPAEIVGSKPIGGGGGEWRFVLCFLCFRVERSQRERITRREESYRL